MKCSIVLFILILFLESCKKEPETSFWTINEETFSSNEIEYSNSKSNTAFGTVSRENGFGMVIRMGSLPSQGCYGIGSYDNNPANFGIVFYFYGKQYVAARAASTCMQASSVGGKCKLNIPPTWFKRLEFDSNLKVIPTDDSVIIEGILSEP